MLQARLDGIGGEQDIYSRPVVLVNGRIEFWIPLISGSGAEGVKNRPSSSDAEGVENSPL